MKRASAIVLSCLFVCLLASASVVQAGGFALYEWSNRGVAMATTGYAVAGDASVIATNPALMTKLEGKHALAGAVVISPQTSVYVDGDKNKTKSKKFVVPHAYYTHQMGDNENVWLGVGMFTRFGLGTYYDDDWVGKASLQYVDLQSISLNPNIAFKFNDQFSAAFGIEILKGGFKLQKEIGAAIVKADTEGYATGVNVGLNYDLDDQWSAAFTYRSQMKMYTTGYGRNDTNAVPDSDSEQVIRATLPSSYTVGVGYQPTDDWTLEFDTIYTRWESVDKLIYEGPIEAETELHYKNTWRFQVGTEYWAKEWLAVRFGYAYDQTPTRAGDASFMLPANDRQLYSTGLGFKWDNWNADWSFMYVTTKSRNNLTMSDPVLGVIDVDFKNGQTWISGLSIGYEF